GTQKIGRDVVAVQTTRDRRPQRVYARVSQRGRSASGENVLDLAEKRVRFTRLQDVRVAASLQRLFAWLALDMPGARDDRDMAGARIRLQPTCDFPAVQTRKREIHHDDVGHHRDDEAQRRRTIRGALDVETLGDEVLRVQLPRIGIVLDEEHERAAAGRSLWG